MSKFLPRICSFGEGSSRVTPVLLCLACSLVLASGCASLTDNERLQKLIAEVRAANAKTAGGVGAVPGTPVSDSEPPAEPSPVLPLPARVTLQPETVVEITVDEDQSLSGTYEVNNASAIRFRYVGLVFLGNMTPEAAETTIKKLLESRGFRTATVKVTIVKASHDTIRVSGWVNEPGLLEIGPGSEISLNDALLRAKGLRAQAKGIKITVARGGLLNPFPVSAAPGRTNEEYALIGPDSKATIPAVMLRGNDVVHVLT